MKHLEIVSLGENKGAPRIWIEGRKAVLGGFTPGTRYNAKVSMDRSLLTLEVASDGMRIVSRKTRGEKELPVIDINSNELLSMFKDLSAVRVVVSQNRIHILPVASELRAKERLERVKEKFAVNAPLDIGAFASGIGVLDLAVHEGMALAGVETKLVFANEIRDDCMEQMAARNPGFGPDTISLTLPMQELTMDRWAMSQLPSPTIFCAGLPCSGASKAGRTKRKLVHPEDHPEIGHMVVSYIAAVGALNPLVCLLENVTPYRSSASMSILRSSLRDLGYDVHEMEVNSADWNMLEHRTRMVMVAVTRGIDFSFDALQRPDPAVHTFGEIMDVVDPAHSTWGNIDYLWGKLERDKADGKGFAPTVVDASSTRLPVLNKSLHKRQSTGTFIRHPTNPSLYRIPTVNEHARAKGIPASLVEGTTQTLGHESLGQSISMPPFVAVFEALGKALRAYGMNCNPIRLPSITRGEALTAA